MLVEFSHSLEIERGILEETMKNLEAMRTKVEFESANLALRWLRRSNCGGDDDGQGSEEDHATDGRKYCYSSSAYAFLQTAIGAFMNDTTPAEVGKERRRRALAERRSRRRATLYVIPLARR